ncbi:hypothetical protein [Dactylosporangium sp. NPDC000521]|uniref:hypothetical protein n=1 Tax=Dactylosporangium sp. NPDC000521 TaxID=3363975 RepID=UPI00368D1546
MAEPRTSDSHDDPAAPRAIGAGEHVTVADLTPGRIIERWTDTSTSTVRVPMPCHERQVVTASRHTVNAVAVCRLCSRTYELTLEPDADGGHFAILTVAYVPHLLSRQAKR